MRPYILLSSFTLLLFYLSSCTGPPDVRLLNEDLGIRIPKNYKLIKADHDPLGPPGDQNITYIFKFDALSFTELIENIENSALFNTASEKDFKTLSVNRKLNIIKVLAQNKMTSYWIKSDSGYTYNGNELFLNDNSKACLKAAELNIFLPNYDMERAFPDGTPLIIYQVKAIVNKKDLTLYYNYVHP